MKLVALIVLGICVLQQHTSAAETDHFKDLEIQLSDSFLETMRKFVETLVNKAKDLVENVKKQVKEFVDSAYNKAEKLFNDAQEKLQETVSKLKDKLGELEQQGEKVKACVEKYKPEFDNVTAQANEAAKYCFSNTHTFVESVKQQARDNVANMKVLVEELNGVLVDCVDLNQPFKSLECTYKQGNKVFEKTKKLALKVFEDVKLAVKGLAPTLYEASKCVAEAVDSSERYLLEVLHKVEQCVQENPDDQ